MMMNVQQAKECIKFSIMSSDKNIKLPIAIWGYHGIGKTEIIKQVAEEMNMNLVVLHLSTQDVTDLIGIPKDKEVIINNKTERVMYWSCPSWLVNAVENTKKTGKNNIFFLDEMNRGSRAVLNAMLPFLIEGKIHTHTIGEKDVVIAAMNPSNESYDTNDIFDKALLDRMGHIILQPTKEEYKNYIKDKVDSITLELIDEYPEFIEIPQINLTFSVTPSRRKIDKVMQKFLLMNDEWIKKYGKYVLECYLGSKFSSNWMKKYFNKNEQDKKKIIKIEHLLNIDIYSSFIKEILTMQINNEVIINMDSFNYCKEILLDYFNKQDIVTKSDIQMLIKFFSIPGMHPTIYKSFFYSTPIRKHIIESLEFNYEIVSFLRKNNLLLD